MKFLLLVMPILPFVSTGCGGISEASHKNFLNPFVQSWLREQLFQNPIYCKPDSKKFLNCCIRRQRYQKSAHLCTIMPETATKEEVKEFSRFLKRAERNSVLKRLPQLHAEAFEEIDCLQCAACCKHYSPRFKTPDVKRIAKHLRLRESELIDTYLRVDEDGDFVVKRTPCPFLGTDNLCTIYEVRPSDCARFPYTDEDVIIKRQALTLKNATFCPIVYHVLHRLTEPAK
jgi:Fe-S-cluster containining protein